MQISNKFISRVCFLFFGFILNWLVLSCRSRCKNFGNILATNDKVVFFLQPQALLLVNWHTWADKIIELEACCKKVTLFYHFILLIIISKSNQEEKPSIFMIKAWQFKFVGHFSILCIFNAKKKSQSSILYPCMLHYSFFGPT